MSRLIPPVLRSTDLPLAVLSAARLDGVLWGIHDGFCPVDEPDRPELRVLALSSVVQPHDIIVGRTAAWVHGAGTRVIGAVEVCSRARPLGSWRTGARYREISFDESDLIQLAPYTPLVTTRARSISDIAVDSLRTIHDGELVLALSGGDPATVRAHADDLAAARRRPRKAAGLEFLDAVVTEATRRGTPCL